LAVAIPAALITALVSGLWFPSTRGIAIAAAALLTLMFPWLGAAIVIGSVAALYVFRIRKP
jgi:predicted phage tail protein